ncbi:MAG: ADP-ribosylglycohydrolase family protein [Actinomycetota bacterium]|nr:ADP-ribosylglycohydrolase family protein [Actinomycetota bacterium]
MKLNSMQRDRACGVLLGTAGGDALGAPYEFEPARGPELVVEMAGGGSFGWTPGEWTDDTAMAIAIAEVAATGIDLRDIAAQDRIVARWVGWARNATDVGIQTRAVFSSVGTGGSDGSRASAEALHRSSGRSGGNGSLMRTAPLALVYLDDEDALVEAAMAISSLTHFDPEAGEACVLWCLAIRHAVLTGELDLRRGLARLSTDRSDVWTARIDAAEANPPSHFANNGWVVEALQAAWSAIARTPVPVESPARRVFRADHFRQALDAAVRAGNDTDTVAAIAGGLLGAVYGASAVPAEWRRLVHGWPGLRASDLVSLADAILRRGAPDDFPYGYSGYGQLHAYAQHPYDDGVWLGGIGALRPLDADIDAVVSLCLVGPADRPDTAELIEVRLIDRDGHNANLSFVLDDTVTLIEQLRAEGKTVLLHCVQAHSRTPTVAALYGARLRGVSTEQALRDVHAVLPAVRPIATFREALRSAGAP